MFWGPDEIRATFVSENRLRISQADLPQRPPAGTEVWLKVANPDGEQPHSVGLKTEVAEPEQGADDPG